jgi:hypothetical protein
MGFAPFAEVSESDMAVIEGIYSGYGEGPESGSIVKQGTPYLTSSFPLLSYIQSAQVVQDSEEVRYLQTVQMLKSAVCEVAALTKHQGNEDEDEDAAEQCRINLASWQVVKSVSGVTECKYRIHGLALVFLKSMGFVEGEAEGGEEGDAADTGGQISLTIPRRALKSLCINNTLACILEALRVFTPGS